MLSISGRAFPDGYVQPGYVQLDYVKSPILMDFGAAITHFWHFSVPTKFNYVFCGISVVKMFVFLGRALITYGKPMVLLQ